MCVCVCWFVYLKDKKDSILKPQNRQWQVYNVFVPAKEYELLSVKLYHFVVKLLSGVR